jgi:hypothetical protein
MAGKTYKTLAEARAAAKKGEIIRMEDIQAGIDETRRKIREDYTKKDKYGRFAASKRSQAAKRKALYAMYDKGGPDGMKILKPGRFKHNPSMTKIYNRVVKIYASKAGMPHNCDAECKKHGHNYVHHFKQKACIYGLPDGSLLVK